MFDIETESKLFNIYITPGVIAEIAAQSKMFDRIKKVDKLELGGTAAKQRVLIKASQSARASSDSGYPAPKQSTPAETLIYLKRAMMFSMQFDGFALECALKEGAAMDPEEFEKQGLFMTVIDDLSRQLIGDGSSRLCQASALGSGIKILPVDSPYYAKATKFLKPGRIIDGYLVAAQEIVSGEIDTVDSDTQVTLKANASWSNDCWIMNEKVFVATEKAGTGEAMGLLGICSNLDPPYPNAANGLQQLPVGTYPDWKAVVKSNGGIKRPLSEDLIISAIDDIELGYITAMLITQKVRRVWVAYLRNFKEFGDKTMWGGWVGIPFYYDGKEIPMVPDKFVPDGHILGIDEDKLTLYVTKKNAEVTWEKQRDGSILQKVAGKNEYVAEGHIFLNMGVSVRKAFFKINDIDEPTA